MIRRVVPGVVALVLLGVAAVLWSYSRVTDTVTESFPTTGDVEGFTITYDSLHVAGPWMGLSVVAAAVAVYLLMRLMIRRPRD